MEPQSSLLNQLVTHDTRLTDTQRQDIFRLSLNIYKCGLMRRAICGCKVCVVVCYFMAHKILIDRFKPVPVSFNLLGKCAPIASIETSILCKAYLHTLHNATFEI